MARGNTIGYMIDPLTNGIWSRVGSEIAIPVLQFSEMTPENNYATKYKLEKFDAVAIAYHIKDTIRTRKVSKEIKNIHRKFWGMKQI